MDICSTDIVTLIFETACRDDYGQTARNLGLVSKDFRAIAEPIELRTIAVSGIDQLRGAVARLERANDAVGRTEFGVQHLFISEMKAEHALAADMKWPKTTIVYGPRESFWKTERGREAEAFYRDHQRSDDFWRMAVNLVKNSSPKLRTLYLLSSDGWLPERGRFSKEVVSWKVQGALSGIEFPHLASLMVNHDVIGESKSSAASFQTPTTPSLRKLCIRSSVFLDPWSSQQSHPSHVHPLLALVHSEASKISHLIISDGGMYDVDKTLRAIFGDDLGTLRKTKELPKELQSVVLQQGIRPIFRCGNGAWSYEASTRSFAKSIQEVGIEGLKTQPPTPTYPKVGEREFELLLAEWKEDVLACAS